MWAIGCIFCIFAFVSALIMPWLNQNAIKQLRVQVDYLQAKLDQLKAEGVKPATQTHAEYTDHARQEAPVKPSPAAPLPQTVAAVSGDKVQEKAAYAFKPDRTMRQEALEHQPKTLEQQFGGKAFVWLGGIALALAGFFMVKYSIETGLLSPVVRVTLGLLFGISLLGAGTWVRSQPRFANGTSISQALSGAGIADLYACLFAATSLYGLLPSFVGFAAMAGVTAVAVVLSLRQGVPIAILGLIGGFLTPALISSTEPSAPLLFLYLYFVVTGLMVVTRKQHWWPLAIPTVFGAFVWVLIWLFSGNFSAGDSFWLGLFLLGVSMTVVMTSQPQKSGDDMDYLFMPSSLFNYLALGGATGLMGLTAAHSGFGMMDWGLFGLLSVGGIALAGFNQRQYGLVPLLTMAVNAVMLMVWTYNTPQEFALILSIFAVLFVVSAWFLQPRSQNPLLWAGIAGAASIGYYLLGYFELHSTALVIGVPMFWGFLAFGLAALAIYALQEVMGNLPDTHPQKQHVMAIYAAAASAFLSIGLTIELNHEFLSVAFAAEALAIAWINTRVNIKALRPITAALVCVFGVLLIPQLILLVQLTVYSLIEAELPLQASIPIVDWPLFQLGAPAVFFTLASIFLRQKKDDRLVQALEITAIALIGLMGYYLMRHAFHANQNILFVKAGFIERGTITNSIFVYGLACLWIGEKLERDAVARSGLVLACVALFRVFYFDLIAYNPLWAQQAVGAMPIFNGLILTYGLPVIWTWQAQRHLPTQNPAWTKGSYGVMLLLAFVFLSMNVRQFYHGTFLNGHMTSDAEIYTYSAVWLVFGVGLLFLGTLRQDRMTRVASLVILLLTVGKVFLYDASELTGLWRVFSFFGLGLSLLGLSWFYSRFVFTARSR